MEAIYRFYKEGDKWYIDLPDFIAAGGSKEALEMVFGADQFLSQMCIIGNKNVMLNISDYKIMGYERLSQTCNKLESGAFYLTDTSFGTHVMWLCDVVKYIFNGQFPKVIYYKQIL